jgi:hypothetical protein
MVFVKWDGKDRGGGVDSVAASYILFQTTSSASLLGTAFGRCNTLCFEVIAVTRRIQCQQIAEEVSITGL